MVVVSLDDVDVAHGTKLRSTWKTRFGPIRKSPDTAKDGQAGNSPMKGAEKLASRPGALKMTRETHASSEKSPEGSQ